jgi:hypothetical protein
MKYSPHFLIKARNAEQYADCLIVLNEVIPPEMDAVFTNVPEGYPEGLGWNLARFHSVERLSAFEALILIDAQELLSGREEITLDWVKVRCEAFSAFPAIAYIGKPLSQEKCTEDMKRKILLSMRNYTYISDEDFENKIKLKTGWGVASTHGVSFNSKALDSLNGFRMFTEYPVLEAQINLQLIGYEFLPIQ